MTSSALLYKVSLSAPYRRVVAICACALVLAACTPARTGAVDAQSTPDYLYDAKFAYVRIEPIESAAPDNAHPVTIAPAALRRMLEDLRAARTLSKDPKPVFTSDELDQMVTPLAKALAKAGARDDVTFASNGFHGWLGKYSPPTITTGRVFVRDGHLNVVFGMVHELYNYTGYAPEVRPSFVPGSRARRIETGWEIAPGEARLEAGRSDWVLFDMSAAPVAAPAPDANVPRATSAPAPQTPTDDGRYQEIERKLLLLDRLKAGGLITDEEYRERRGAVLQGL